MEKRIPIITLTGSGRFIEQGIELAIELERCGCIVFWIFANSYSSVKNNVFNRKYKAMADMVYIHKIQLSDLLVVLDYEGYIGESTEREICYGKTIGISILYVSEFGDNPENIYNIVIENKKNGGLNVKNKYG